MIVPCYQLHCFDLPSLETWPCAWKAQPVDHQAAQCEERRRPRNSLEVIAVMATEESECTSGLRHVEEADELLLLVQRVADSDGDEATTVFPRFAQIVRARPERSMRQVAALLALTLPHRRRRTATTASPPPPPGTAFVARAGQQVSGAGAAAGPAAGERGAAAGGSAAHNGG